jgi:FHA domain-containing protein
MNLSGLISNQFKKGFQMTAQSIGTPSASEQLSAVGKPETIEPIPVNTGKSDGSTKRLVDNPFVQMQTPVTFLLIDADIALTVQLADQVFIGRRDDDFKPGDKLDIDLMEYGAREKGISRRHAMLCRISNKLSIVDLNSTNGTYLNGLRLVPERPFFLQDGDEICFGKMPCHIHFAH